MRRVLALVVLAGCVPDLDVDESILDAPRIVAIRSVPAEAPPGASVTVEALYADATGAITAAPIEWAFCRARRPLAELGSVASACLAWESDDLVVLGTGASATGTIPRDVCRLFGPEPPPSEPGEPAGRIAEPDATGGYAIPVRAIEPDDDALAFGAVRITCGVGGATQEIAAELRRRYRANEPPAVAAIEVVRDSGAREAVTDRFVVTPGERLEIVASWADCPSTDTCGDAVCGIDETATDCASDCASPRGCSGAERYLRWDPDSGALVEPREAIRSRWLTTGGRFETERSGRAGADPARELSSPWVAPSDPGEVVLFVVLRDERGGTGWRELRADVVP